MIRYETLVLLNLDPNLDLISLVLEIRIRTKIKIRVKIKKQFVANGRQP